MEDGETNMKRVTLIIPDEFDKLLSVVIIGNSVKGNEAAQFLEVLPPDKSELIFDLAAKIKEVEYESKKL